MILAVFCTTMLDSVPQECRYFTTVYIVPWIILIFIIEQISMHVSIGSSGHQYDSSLRVFMEFSAVQLASSSLINVMLFLLWTVWKTMRNPTNLVLISSKVEAFVLDANEARLLKALDQVQASYNERVGSIYQRENFFMKFISSCCNFRSISHHDGSK